MMERVAIFSEETWREQVLFFKEIDSKQLDF